MTQVFFHANYKTGFNVQSWGDSNLIQPWAWQKAPSLERDVEIFCKDNRNWPPWKLYRPKLTFLPFLADKQALCTRIRDTEKNFDRIKSYWMQSFAICWEDAERNLGPVCLFSLISVAFISFWYLSSRFVFFISFTAKSDTPNFIAIKTGGLGLSLTELRIIETVLI